MKRRWRNILGSVAAGLVLLAASQSGAGSSGRESDRNGQFREAGRSGAMDCDRLPEFDRARISRCSPQVAASIFLKEDTEQFGVLSIRPAECLERALSFQMAGCSREVLPVQRVDSDENLFLKISSYAARGSALNGYRPGGDTGTFDFWDSSWFDKPKLQFQFAYNRHVPEKFVPFSMPTSYSRKENTFFRDDFVSYYATAGGLIFPGYSRLANMVNSGLRLSDKLVPHDSYSGLSNEVEHENPLLGYLSSFTGPLSPMLIKTYYKSFDSNSQNVAATGLIRSDHFPFNRHDAGLDAFWEFNSFFSINAGYRWQRWERDPEYWENASTDEHMPKVVLKVSPSQWLNVLASFSQSIRTGSDYKLMKADPELPEQVLLPKFSLSDRTRSSFDFATQISPSKDLGISLHCGFTIDSYDNSEYRLIDGESWSAGASIAWSPISRLILSAEFLHEEFQTRQLAGNASAIFDSRDRLDSIGAGLNLILIPEKLNFVARGSYSISKSDGMAGRLGGVCVLSRFENFLRLQYSKELSFRCGYLFEGFGAGQGSIALTDPSLESPLRDYSAHVMVGVINYEF